MRGSSSWSGPRSPQVAVLLVARGRLTLSNATLRPPRGRVRNDYLGDCTTSRHAAGRSVDAAGLQPKRLPLQGPRTRAGRPSPVDVGPVELTGPRQQQLVVLDAGSSRSGRRPRHNRPNAAVYGRSPRASGARRATAQPNGCRRGSCPAAAQRRWPRRRGEVATARVGGGCCCRRHPLRLAPVGAVTCHGVACGHPVFAGPSPDARSTSVRGARRVVLGDVACRRGPSSLAATGMAGMAGHWRRRG